MKVEHLLAGGIDLHTHSSPSLFQRALNDYELAREAKEAGMRGVVIKAHECPTASRAVLIDQKIEGVSTFGGVVLNQYVGGWNLAAVDAALKMGGKFVWLPTVFAQNHLDYHADHQDMVPTEHELRIPLKGLTVHGEDGKVRPEVHEILEMVAEADVILGTGHLSAREIFAVVDAARDAGVRKILVNHADMEFNGLTLEAQIALASKGAILEKCYLTLHWHQRGVTSQSMAQGIKAIGSEHCVLVTDLGQVTNPHPVDGMRAFIEILLHEGISEEEIRKMLSEIPARLLGIHEE